MTDNKIIKALECFKGETCLGDECPYFKINNGCGDMLKDVYDLINRQKAEIERLERVVSIKQKNKQTIKSEAIKEFAQRLKEVFTTIDGTFECWECEEHIDDLVKEMTEESK